MINRVGLVRFFSCSVGNQPFSVGLVDLLFQPTRNPVETMGINRYHNRGLLSVVLRHDLWLIKIFFKAYDPSIEQSTKRRSRSENM